MASGADIIDRICDVAKMNKTAASADRVLALSFVQEAMDRIVVDAELNVEATTSVALSADTSSYELNVSPFPTDILRITDFTITDNAITRSVLDRISMHDMNNFRIGDVSGGTPYVYAIDWPRLVIHPAPTTTATLNLDYIKAAPTMTDDATAITIIPAAFQWGCLYELAMWRAFQYKKQDEAPQHQAAYLTDGTAGLPALRRWKVMAGGRQGPEGAGGTIRRVFSPSQDWGY